MKILPKNKTKREISRKELGAVCRLKTEAERREALVPLVAKMLEREPSFVSLHNWQREIMTLCAANMASGLVELHVGSNAASSLPKGKGLFRVIDDIASNLVSVMIRNSGLKLLGETIEETVSQFAGLLEDARHANKVDEFLRSLPVGNILKTLEGSVREKLN